MMAIIQYGIRDLHLKWSHLIAGGTFTVPFIPWGRGTWVTGHLWSLGVEEHFYLLWPFALAYFGISGGVRFGLVICLTVPILRIIWNVTGISELPNSFFGIGDVMIYGCFAAILADRMPERVRVIVGSRTMLGRIVAVLAVVAISRLVPTRFGMYVAPFGGSVVGLAIAYLLLSYTHAPIGWTYQVLNWRPVAALGVLSYILYLWQRPFLIPVYEGNPDWHSFPFNLAGSLLAALISYCLIERPFLKLRARLSTAAQSRGVLDQFSAASQQPLSAVGRLSRGACLDDTGIL